MGIELDLFVTAPSQSLICVVCQGVVDTPVLTPTECLYCEECLLDWMQRSPTCPSTQVALNPEDIKKPSRLVMNILSELVRYCDYKMEGCRWQGSCEMYTAHRRTCPCRPREVLAQQLAAQEDVNASLQRRADDLTTRMRQLEETNKDLHNKLSLAAAKLRVYDAFFADDGGGGGLLQRPDMSALERRDGKSAYDEINEFYRRDMLSMPDDFDDDDREGVDDEYEEHEEEEDSDDAGALTKALAGADDGKEYQGGAHHPAKSVEAKKGAAYELSRLRGLNTFDARK